MTRTENSLRNIYFSIFFQAVQTIVTFFARKVFVLVLTQEYLGLNGIFSNILSMLSLAELGIGTAITYSLYKPLAEQDRAQITALIDLYRRSYRVIGIVITTLGACAAPFLPVLIRELPDIPHIYLIYLLFVLNTALSYFHVYKQSLIIADQQQYIVTACQSLSQIALQIAQAAFLWFTGNYFVYLGLQIGTTLLKNLSLSCIADRRYPYIRTERPSLLDPEIRKEIIKNTKAMVVHKTATIVVFSTDNLLISYFAGVIEVGIYSNYQMLANALISIYTQLFGALTASIGNLGIIGDSKQVLTVFNRLSFACRWLYGFSSVCLFALLNPFIELWVGADYLFDQRIVCLIVLNFYMYGMRQTQLTFHEANGLYWYDRYKPAAEAAINFVVSAVLAVPYGIAGILAGTFISTITTCFWVEPLVLFRHVMHASLKPFFRDYAVNTALTLLTAAVVWHICGLLPGTGILSFAAKAAVCVLVGNLGYLVVYCRRDEFGYFVGLLKRVLGR